MDIVNGEAVAQGALCIACGGVCSVFCGLECAPTLGLTSFVVVLLNIIGGNGIATSM